ncbi:MAG TPA: hypothetical protein VM098_01190 [Phycisphaerae bacterium]|nr:hypothetical protein [Phycisphaerae bacterium]
MNHRALLPRAGLWAAAIAGWVLAAGSALPAETDAGDSWDRYRVLVERNMFLRNRRPPRPPGQSGGSTVRLVRDSDRDIILTGISRHDDEYVAFFENTATGLTSRIGTGQPVGKGRTRSITLDGVEYERDGAVTQIEVGRTLTGTYVVRTTTRPAATQPAGPPSGPEESATQPAETTTDSSAAPPAAPPEGPGGSNVMDIEEQMRRRREQELRR